MFSLYGIHVDLVALFLSIYRRTVKRHDWGRPGKRSQDVTVSLDDTGLDKMTSSRWQSIASISEAVFEKFVREAVYAGKELTKTASRAGLAR